MEFECKNRLDKLMVILRGFGLVVLYVAIIVLLTALLKLSPIKDYGDGAISIIADLIVTTILVLLFSRRLKNDFKDFKNNYKKYLKQAIPYWIVGLIIMMASNIIINVVLSNGVAANEAANREALGNFPLASIISMCILAPICEELLFRASFKNAFTKIVPYCLFTGIFFAFMHVVSGSSLTELLYLIPYAAVGIAFSYAYFKTNNIFTSISLHIIHNTLTVLLILPAILRG